MTHADLYNDPVRGSCKTLYQLQRRMNEMAMSFRSRATKLRAIIATFCRANQSKAHDKSEWGGLSTKVHLAMGHETRAISTCTTSRNMIPIKMRISPAAKNMTSEAAGTETNSQKICSVCRSAEQRA